MEARLEVVGADYGGGGIVFSRGSNFYTYGIAAAGLHVNVAVESFDKLVEVLDNDPHAEEWVLDGEPDFERFAVFVVGIRNPEE